MVNQIYQANGLSLRKGKYTAPLEVTCSGLSELTLKSGREAVDGKQLELLGGKNGGDVTIYSAGNLSLLKQKTVAIVGSRAASEEGQRRAARLARELANSNVVISSGLAKGIDTAAMTSAIEAGGRVVGVIGTPIDKAYPAENKFLQEEVYKSHLLLTPFQIGQRVFPSNFPQRNRVMAMLSDATVIIEASDTSGTLHQAAECIRQKRLLFIAKSVINNAELSWPVKFLGQHGVFVLEKTTDILEKL